MIADVRWLTRFALMMLMMIVLTGVGTAVGLPWLVWLGVPLAGVFVLRNLKRRGIEFGEFAKQVIKCIAIGGAVGTGIIAILLLAVSLGLGAFSSAVFLIAPIAFLWFAGRAGAFVLWKATLTTLYGTWFQGKGDWYRAVLKGGAGHWDESREALARYEQRNPHDPMIPMRRAYDLIRTGHYEDAMTEVERSLSWRRTAESLAVRGQVYLACGGTDSALADFRSSLELNAKNPYIEVMVGAALVEKRQLKQAIDTIKSAERGALRYTSATFHLANAYRLSGAQEETAKAWRETRTTARRDLSADIVVSEPILGCALAQLGKLDEAEKVLRSALENGADRATTLYGLALLAYRRGLLDAAEDAFQELISFRPHLAMSTLMDPLFTPLLTEARFRQLLGRALDERNRLLQRVGSQAGDGQG